MNRIGEQSERRNSVLGMSAALLASTYQATELPAWNAISGEFSVPTPDAVIVTMFHCRDPCPRWCPQQPPATPRGYMPREATMAQQICLPNVS